MKNAPLRSPDPAFGSAATAASSAQLPDYLRSATPNPTANRVPWYKSTAPTYAGIFLWFAFWDRMSGNGLAAGGLGPTLLGVVLGALICHFLFFIVPGRLGMQTGLPLYVVGSSTFGAAGSLIMPGFFMGILQFGWLGVNIYFSSMALAGGTGGLFIPMCIIWGALAAFVGLKGIQYVAKVATYLPLIPLVVLLMALVKFGPQAGSYTPPAGGVGGLNATLAMGAAIVGFFATAGAAGVDICSSNRDKRDVSLGGWVGVVIAIVFTAGVSVVAVAGARQMGVLGASDIALTDAIQKAFPGLAKAIMIGLAIASFPGACFSSFIAANSFKTVMPKVNPFLSVGIGTIISIILAVTQVAGKLTDVFGLIGASFGPIVGAMVVDYLLSGGKWVGPRAGVNLPGWIAWAVGFIVGILPNGLIPESVRVNIPCAPVAAFIVGAVVYFICVKAGLSSPVIPFNKPAKA